MDLKEIVLIICIIGMIASIIGLIIAMVKIGSKK
jgi:hypothetical protein